MQWRSRTRVLKPTATPSVLSLSLQRREGRLLHSVFHSHFHSISVSHFPLSPYFPFLLPIQSFSGSFSFCSTSLLWDEGDGDQIVPENEKKTKKTLPAFSPHGASLLKAALSRKQCGAESQQDVCHVRGRQCCVLAGCLCVSLRHVSC